MTAFFRATILVVALFALCGAASGSSALLRSNSRTTPVLPPARTYDGATAVTVTLVHPSPALTLVLLTDGADPTDFDGLKKDVVSLYSALPGRSIRLAIIRDGELQVLGPMVSRARLQSVLKEIEPAQTPATFSPATMFDSLSAKRLATPSSAAVAGNQLTRSC